MKMTKENHRVVVSGVFQSEIVWIGEFAEENRADVTYYFVAHVQHDTAIYSHMVTTYPDGRIGISRYLTGVDVSPNLLKFIQKLEHRNRHRLSSKFEEVYVHRPQIKGIMPADHRLYRD